MGPYEVSPLVTEKVPESQSSSLTGAGVSLKAFGTPLTGLELQPTQPVQGKSPAQPANSCCFDKQHIEDNIKGSFDNEKYLVFDIGQDPNFLTVTGMRFAFARSKIA